MPRKPSNRPTDAELAILRILWDLGPCTVRKVYEQLERREEIGYTTVLKTLQIMAEKDLVQRDESERAHVYEAVTGEDDTQQHLLSDLLDRAFKGSSSKLVMQALSTGRASPQEIAEIRRLLEKMSGD